MSPLHAQLPKGQPPRDKAISLEKRSQLSALSHSLAAPIKPKDPDPSLGPFICSGSDAPGWFPGHQTLFSAPWEHYPMPPSTMLATSLFLAPHTSTP